MNNPTTSKPLCPNGWAIPPTPLMLANGNDYHTCSICGEKADAVTPLVGQQELDDIILHIAHHAGLIERGKTITADWFPYAQAAIQSVITEAVVKELGNLKAAKGRFSTSGYGLWVDNQIDGRIAELQASKATGEL